MLNRRPGVSAFCWVLAFCTTSYHQRVSETTGAPEAPFGREWLSLPHLISNVFDPQLSRGPRAPSAWCGFPYHIPSSNSTRSLTVWLLVLTELYNSSTPTQSPTQSLEWHVWLSSSGNNCHEVQRSLSSDTSVYECTMGFFTLSHFVSQARLIDFLS